MMLWNCLILMVVWSVVHYMRGTSATKPGCTVEELQKVNATVDMNLGTTLDKVNNDITLANLKSGRAFCARVRDGFYVQVEFRTIRAVKELKLQGFRLNGTNYRIASFMLEFSLTGHSWHRYKETESDTPKYFMLPNSGDSETVLQSKLPEPATGKFIRLIVPRSNNNGQLNMCIRFDVYGCKDVPPPTLKTKKVVKATLDSPLALKCSGTGMLGMVIRWLQDNNTKKNLSKLRGTLDSEMGLTVKLSDLLSYSCTTDATGATCTRVFTCNSFYQFDPTVEKNSTTKVVVDVKPPDEVRWFKVLKKTRNEVIVQWDKPSLYDFKPSHFRYDLTCNATGRPVTRLVEYHDNNSASISVPEVYFPVHCSLQLKRNNTDQLPFTFKQRALSLNFRSKSIRPAVKPRFLVTSVSARSATFRIRCSFTDRGYGRAVAILINATMLMYANRLPTGSVLADRSKKIMLKSGPTTFINSSFTMGNLRPWSKYNLKVGVLNEDGLMSDTAMRDITTREGRPTRGPSLRLVGDTSQNSVSVEIKQKDDWMYNNGEVTGYRIQYQNGRRPKDKLLVKHEYKKHNPKNIFENMKLKPNTFYKIRAQTFTLAGSGPYGEALEVWTKSGIPKQPDGLRTVRDSSNLEVEWSQEGHEKITKYEIRVTFNNHTVTVFNHKHTRSRRFPFLMSSVQQISIRSCTNKLGTTCSEWSPALIMNHDNSVSKQTALIIGFSVAFALFAAFVVMCFVYFRRQYRAHPPKDYPLQVRTPCYNEDEDNQHPLTMPDSDDDTLGPAESLTNSVSSHGSGTYNRGGGGGSAQNPIPVGEFTAYINRIRDDNYRALHDDFRKQLPVGQLYPCYVASATENLPKNRYTNICAYDHSRILLKFDEFDDEEEGSAGQGLIANGSGGSTSTTATTSTTTTRRSDYINANAIHSYTENIGGKYKYISTQGPLEHTIPDFWHMVWQEGSTIIVMLTNLKENEKVKCAQYWPHEGTKVYGKISVTLDKIDKTADYIMRTFVLQRVGTNEMRIIRQFHFVPWPDHGVPDYPTALLSLRRRVRWYGDEGRPMIVHCSAGVGRTGCFILIDAMLERIDNEGTVDILSYLNYMRTQRIYMVQTFDQYIFAHTAVLEYITFGNTETFLNELHRKFKQLVCGNGMEEEFQLLEQNKTIGSSASKSAELQNEHFDPTLASLGASMIDGFKQRNAFILMEAPSEQTAEMFWKVVLEKQCHTIVMLNKCTEDGDGAKYFKYWPDVEGHHSYEDIAVMLNTEVANGNIMTRKLKVTTNNASNTMTNRRCEVNHFQFTDWPTTDVPEERVYSNVCTLMQAVEKSQHNLGNGPILVHSGADYGRSGTFIAVYNSTERLKVEQLVDVLQCVRAIRISQPLAVDNVGQYRFIYNMLRTYLEGFENYCNYKEYNACRSPFGSTSSSSL